MRFKQNTSVSTATSQGVGHIDRVVIDPTTKRVTHLVVRQGQLFTDERVVPVDFIAAAAADHITLCPEVSDLHTLPKFEERQYLRVTETDRRTAAGYGYPPAGSQYAKQVRQNIPEGTVALREGAKVITDDGRLA